MRTHIITVIDTSGSMQRLLPEVASGMDEFVRTQSRLPGEALISMYAFGSTVQQLCRVHPLDNAPSMSSLRVNGMTALNDAIGKALTDAPVVGFDQTIVVIGTDGEENFSKRYDKTMVRHLISERKERGWQFIFMAANQDAITTATNYGIPREFAYSFDATAKGAADAMAYATTTTSAIRGTTF